MSKFKEYTHKDKPDIQYVDVNNLTRYFSYSDLQSKTRPFIEFLPNLKNTIKTQTQKLFGYQFYFDQSINIKQPKALWKFYASKFRIQKQNLKSVIQTTCNILNYLRMIITYAKKSFDMFYDDNVEEIIIRNVLEVEVQPNQMKEISQIKSYCKGFSRVIHVKIQQQQNQLIVFVGFTDKYKQFIYFLLAFREFNMNRMKLDSTINIGHFDSIIEHLILIMRKIAGQNDFNLYGKEAKTVLESCIIVPFSKQSIYNKNLLIQKFNENRRLLLLYECNCAYYSIYNTTTDRQLSTLLQDQNLYKFLYKLLINTKGLLIKNQQISYGSTTEIKQNTQQLVTIISVSKKSNSPSQFYEPQEFIQLVIQKLVDFFEQSSIKKQRRNIFDESIKTSIKLLNNSRNIMKSRIQSDGNKLISIPIKTKFSTDHFYLQYQRLKKVFKQRVISPAMVEQLIYKIRNLHKKIMQRVKKSHQKNNKKKLESIVKESIQIYYLSIGKAFKKLSTNPDNIINILKHNQQRIQNLLNILIEGNPYCSVGLISKLLKLIIPNSLQKCYNNFLKSNNLQFTRKQLLYQFLFQVFKTKNFDLELSNIDIEEDIIFLLSKPSQADFNQVYFSLMQKLAPVIFSKKSNKDFWIIQSIFKNLEDQLKKISTKDSIYSFLGSLYFQTVFSLKSKSQIKLQNSVYKTKNISQLTSQIKKQKTIELVKRGGVNSQIFTIKKFFGQLTFLLKDNLNPYEIYKDFILNNFNLNILLRQISSAPLSIDIYAVQKYFQANIYKFDKFLQNQGGITIFSYFEEDIQNYNYPNQIQQMNITNDLNKTLTQSGVVKNLFQLNPNTKLAGVQIKNLFSLSQKKQKQINLYDYDTMIEKVYGIKLVEAEELLNIFYNLEQKFINFRSLSQQQKMFFNAKIKDILDNQLKLTRYIERTLELEEFLYKLQEQQNKKFG